LRRYVEEGEKESIEFLLTECLDPCNSMLMAWLLNVIKLTLHSSVGYGVIAKTMWDDLKERYGAQSAPKIYQLKSELSSWK